MSDIIVCGDLHGDWKSLNRLLNKKSPATILQCGDFGWWPKFHIGRAVTDGYMQKLWDCKGIKSPNTDIYFCDGNHEQHDVLEDNGKINKLYDRVYHCSRGSTLELSNGEKVLFIGGASSVDKSSRIIGHDWFPEENITQKQVNRCIEAKSADIVVSHTCPSYVDIHFGLQKKKTDSDRIALDCILENVSGIKTWYFGHWHTYFNEIINGIKFVGLDYPKHGKQWWIKHK